MPVKHTFTVLKARFALKRGAPKNKGDYMESKLFIAGILIGTVGGALLVAHSVKARSTIKECEKKIQQKADDLCKNFKQTQNGKDENAEA